MLCCQLCVMVAARILTACAHKPAPLTPVPDYGAIMLQSCNVQGCCVGHGGVAALQPDRLLMCRDGQVSQICDCHQ